VAVNASCGTAFKAPSFNDLYFPGFLSRISSLRRARELGVVSGAGISVRPAFRRRHRMAQQGRQVDRVPVRRVVHLPAAERDCARAPGVTLGLDVDRGDASVKASLDLQDPGRDQRQTAAGARSSTARWHSRSSSDRCGLASK
jgi:outer membrane cobalamin receptor